MFLLGCFLRCILFLWMRHILLLLCIACDLLLKTGYFKKQTPLPGFACWLHAGETLAYQPGMHFFSYLCYPYICAHALFPGLPLVWLLLMSSSVRLTPLLILGMLAVLLYFSIYNHLPQMSVSVMSFRMVFTSCTCCFQCFPPFWTMSHFWLSELCVGCPKTSPSGIP